MITPQEFANAMDELTKIAFIQDQVRPRKLIEEFIKTSDATQLRAGLRLVKEVNGLTMGYIESALKASELRFQEESLQATERHIKQTEELNRLTGSHIEHTKKLTAQTDTLITEAKNLNEQNKILVTESKKLGRLTWGLFWLTVVLATLTAGLLYIDWHREHEPTTTTANIK